MKELIINQDLKKENLFSDKNFKAKFASSHLEEHLLSLESKKHILKMDFVTKLKQFKTTKISSNQVIYQDIDQGIDLEYQCLEDKIKESLIIKEKQNSYQYEFIIDIGDLKPFFNSQKNILELKNNNETIYSILSPYMEDSNHQKSEDCHYEIEQTNSKLKLILFCSSQWINSEERMFPIIVDPTIAIENTQQFYMCGLQNGSPTDFMETTTATKLPIGRVGTAIEVSVL